MSVLSPVERAHSRTLLFVSLLALVLFAIRNLPWNLDEYDQAKQAFVSYQMISQGRWLYQTTPAEGLGSGGHAHGRIATKPPAMGWISAAIFMVTRSWDLAWRLPSFVSAIVLGALLWKFGEASFGEFPGLIALAAFSLNIVTVRLATLVRTDMSLALVSFLVGWLMFDKIRTRTPWTTGQRICLFLLLTAAMFVKGPIVWAFVLPPLVFYQLRRKWRDDFPRVWSGWWPWVASFGLFCIWVWGGIHYIEGFYQDVVLREFAGRFEHDVHGSQPFLFYVTHLLEKFAPWSLLMIGLLIITLRHTRIVSHRWFSRVSPEMFWLISWALGAIAVMSLIPSKRVDRIFPAIPPLCFLLAAQFQACERERWITARINQIGCYILIAAVAYISSYTLLNVVSGYREDRASLERFGREVRRLAATEHLAYEIVAGRDEGLLLYLQRPQFTSLKTASDLWTARKINGLVFPDGTLQLDQADIRRHASKGGDHPASYSFVTRNDLSPSVNGLH